MARSLNNQRGGKRAGAGRPASERRKHQRAMARMAGCSEQLMGKATAAFERIEPMLGGDRWLELSVKHGASVGALYELSNRSERCMAFVYLVVVGWYGDDVKAKGVRQGIRWFELVEIFEAEGL